MTRLKLTSTNMVEIPMEPKDETSVFSEVFCHVRELYACNMTCAEAAKDTVRAASLNDHQAHMIKGSTFMIDGETFIIVKRLGWSRFEVCKLS